MEKLLSYVPYEMLIETDVGTDHSTITFQNKFSIFDMFLVTRVDKLVVIHSCPGLLYLNKVERKMIFLNIGLSNIALQMKP